MAYIYNLTDTWNNVGTAFNGIKIVVTNTASAASSYILNVSATGATTGSFTVDKSGAGAISGGFTTGGSVGVNTTTTNNTLSVNGNIGLATTGYLTFSASAASGSNYAMYGDGSATIINAPSATFIGLKIGNVETARLTGSGGNFLLSQTSIGTYTSNKTIMFGDTGICINKRFLAVANNGTADITMDTGGYGTMGTLLVESCSSSNAGIATRTAYISLGRGATYTFTSIATQNGASASSFTVTSPANGTIRVTNTSGVNADITIAYFGARTG